MPWYDFSHEESHLQQIAQLMLAQARERGASDAAVEVSETCGLSVNVRMGDTETLEQTRDRVAGVTVYVGQRRGNASTSDLGEQALADTVQRALDIARYTAEDTASGLPDADELATDSPDLDLFHPWPISAEQAAEMAIAAESAAFKVSKKIKNSDGAGVSAYHGQFAAANSRGFAGGFRYSRHSLSVAPIAAQGKLMQRDHWYTAHRVPGKLSDPAEVGRYAAERALARLGATKLSTRDVPVLFDPSLSAGLLGSFVQAASGGALYRQSSFLVDQLGQPIFSDHIDIHEDPFIPQAMGSGAYDDEGVRTQARDLVQAGVLHGYFLSTYTARKLGMKTTGNAGGSHNLRMTSRLTQAGDDLPAMLKKMGTGLLVTELMGQGINYVTGDYSRGAFGYWIENGQIMHPVEEITIAGNLRDMFKQIVAIGADELIRGNKQVGSILIERMTIAGS